MKSVFAQLTTVVLLAGSAMAQFMVNTPASAVVCQPLLITWTGGTPPYFLSLLPGNQPTAAALVDLGQIDSGESFRWIVNQPVNTLLGINLRDSTGALVQSAAFSVQAGGDTSCVGKTDSASSSSTSGSASSSSGSVSTSGSVVSTTRSTTTPAITTTTTPRTATSTPATSVTRSGSSSSASSSSTAAPNSASSKFGHFGLAGVVGAAAVALLA